MPDRPDSSADLDWQDTLWREWKHTRYERLAVRIFEALADAKPSVRARAHAAISSAPLRVAPLLLVLALISAVVAATGLGEGPPVVLGLALVGGVALAVCASRATPLLKAGTWAELVGRALDPRGRAHQERGRRRTAALAWERRHTMVWWRTRPDPREVAEALLHPEAPEWAHVMGEAALKTDCSDPDTVAGYLGSQDPVRNLAGRVASMRLGARALPALARALVDGPWVPDEREILRRVARETLKQYGAEPRSFVCPECFTRYRAMGGPGTRWGTVRFVACPVCLGSTNPIEHAGPIVAALDSRMSDETKWRGDVLRVNWLLRASRNGYEGLELFDFDAVDIAHASDEQVRHFLVDVVNDTDEKRRKRYRALECTVSCALTENTLHGLREVFGRVTH